MYGCQQEVAMTVGTFAKPQNAATAALTAQEVAQAPVHVRRVVEKASTAENAMIPIATQA